jgi:murein tripeptide amidase MpaA
VRSVTPSGVRTIEPKCADVRNAIFVTGRVHPGESPSSHVVHGLIEYLLSNAAEAAALRKLATWIVVPMLNPDGVAAGNYRCDAGTLHPRKNLLLNAGENDVAVDAYHL